jgi:hypothetical protein
LTSFYKLPYGPSVAAILRPQTGSDEPGENDMNTAPITDEMNSVIVDAFRGRQITRGEFAAAFDLVADKANWKLAIDAEVPAVGEFEIYVLKQAVIFFTASIPQIETVAPGRVRVKADGYYAAVGA